MYVWGRRHPYVSLSFLGVFTFSAPYLPWVLLGFSIVLRSSPVVDLCGMVAGALPHAPQYSAIPLWPTRLLQGCCRRAVCPCDAARPQPCSQLSGQGRSEPDGTAVCKLPSSGVPS